MDKKNRNTEDTEFLQRTQRKALVTEDTEKDLGVRSDSTGCIPGAPGTRFLGRDFGAPGITSGCAGSRLRRARAARATAPSASSVDFRVFRDQPSLE